MSLKIWSGALATACILFSCTPTGTSNPGTGTDGNTTQTSLIVQTLTPICTQAVRDQDLIPQIAKDVGITEQAVCDCGLRRTETKFKEEPQLVVTIINDRDKQIEIMTELATECTQELAQQAIQRGLSGGNNTGNNTGNTTNNTNTNSMN